MLKSVPSTEREYKFQAIPSKVDMAQLNDEVVADLSSDQHYGYRYNLSEYNSKHCLKHIQFEG